MTWIWKHCKTPKNQFDIIGSSSIEILNYELQNNFYNDNNCLFICIIGLLATDEEIIFINNIDELIFKNVSQMVTLKGTVKN